MSRFSLDSLISEYEKRKKVEAEKERNGQDLLLLRKKEELDDAINCKKAIAGPYIQRIRELRDSMVNPADAQEVVETAENCFKNFIQNLEDLNPEINTPKDVANIFDSYRKDLLKLINSPIFSMVKLVERFIESFDKLNVYENILKNDEATVTLVYYKGVEVDYTNSTYDEERTLYYQRLRIFDKYQNDFIDELPIFEKVKMERYRTPESKVGYICITKFMEQFVNTLKNMIEGLDVVSKQEDNRWKLILKKNN